MRMKQWLTLSLFALGVGYLGAGADGCSSPDYTTAKMALQNKDYPKAEEYLVKETTSKPENVEAWTQLAQVRYELHNYEGMADAYAKAVALDPSKAEEAKRSSQAAWAQTYNTGVSYLNPKPVPNGTARAANPDSARFYFRRALKLLPDSVFVYTSLARTYSNEQKYDDAVSVYKEYQAKVPADPDPLIRISEIYLRATPKRTAEAIQTLEQVRKMTLSDDTKRDVLSVLADAYIAAGREAEAKDVFRSAVEADPSNALMHYNYGVVLLKAEDYAGAIDQFTKTTQLQDTLTVAHQNLGIAYFNWGVKMKNDAEKAIEALPARQQRTAQINEAYKEKFRMAIPHLQTVTQRQPDDMQTWDTLGRIYSQLGMTKEAEAAFKKSGMR